MERKMLERWKRKEEKAGVLTHSHTQSLAKKGLPIRLGTFKSCGCVFLMYLITQNLCLQDGQYRRHTFRVSHVKCIVICHDGKNGFTETAPWEWYDRGVSNTEKAVSIFIHQDKWCGKRPSFEVYLRVVCGLNIKRSRLVQSPPITGSNLE